ncbi:MAG: hypothetical protein K8T89_14365, partial [Planctomycetes bacterium]|nr:hypothetical protein [Planctomycetota bacterium]
MRPWIHVPALLISMAIIVSLEAQGADKDKSWVGESILPTKPGKDIKFGDRVDGKQVYFPFPNIWPFKVREEKEGWLRLHDGRREGWVDKNDFVLASEAFTYFDNRVQNNPRDGFALAMRGAFWLEKREPDKAIKDFDECIRLNAKDSPAFNNRGQSWFVKKDLEK